MNADENTERFEERFEDARVKLLELEFLLDAAFRVCEARDLLQCEMGLLLAQEKLKEVKEALQMKNPEKPYL